MMMLDKLASRALMLAVFSLCATIAQRAAAAEPEWPERTVTLQAQEQSLGDFLRELFRAAGMRALPSDEVSGRISGRFSDLPKNIFNDVVKAYDLLPYYDGAVMHVSSAREIRTKSIRAQPPEIDRIEKTLNASKLVDRNQSIQVSRDNGVIKVRGAPEFIADVDELIADQRQPERTQPTASASKGEPTAAAAQTLVFRSFQLKYASAADQTFYQNGQEARIPGVVSLLRSMTGMSNSLIATSTTPEARRGQSMPSVRGQGLRRFDREDKDESKDSEDDQQRGAEPASASGLVSERESGVRIEADPNLNAVLVRDYQDSMQLYEQLIAQLDREPQLVEVQVTIVDIDRAKLNDLGVDWRFDDGRNSVAAGGGDPGPQNGGLLLNTVLGDSGNFLARVNALAKDGSAQIISRPQVLTLSNLEAILATDQSFFVRVAGDEEVDLFDVSVGTSLRVVPQVSGESSDPQIRLRVAIEDGSLSEQTVDDIPIVDRATLNTQAVIYDGQSLLLGGLVRDESTKDATKVPMLGDVPGIGRLFKRTTDVKSTQERLFLISPRIMATNRTPAAAPAPAAPPSSAAPNPIAAAGATTPPPGRNNSQSTAQPPQGYLDGF